MSASMKPLLSAELEALHAPSDPLNAQLVIGSVLEAARSFSCFCCFVSKPGTPETIDDLRQPTTVSFLSSQPTVLTALNPRSPHGKRAKAGDYVLRVADDHYQGQVGDGQACFPFSFEFRARAVNAFSVQPTVMSVQPHPSVPIAKGVDLVLTLRFSEPPEGSIEDVVRKFSLGGVHAVTGGSMNAMEGQYASQKQTTVQVSTAEGHLVWVLGWNAQAHGKKHGTCVRTCRHRSPTCRHDASCVGSLLLRTRKRRRPSYSCHARAGARTDEEPEAEDQRPQANALP